MRTVVVINVVNGGTLSVWPAVRFNGRSNSLIRVRGLESEEVSDALVQRLRERLLGSCIHVTNIHGMVDGAVLCDVHFSGRDLVEHFPEYA